MGITLFKRMKKNGLEPGNCVFCRNLRPSNILSDRLLNVVIGEQVGAKAYMLVGLEWRILEGYQAVRRGVYERSTRSG